MKRALLEFDSNPLFYLARKVPGKSTGASKKAIPGSVKFPLPGARFSKDPVNYRAR